MQQADVASSNPSSVVMMSIRNNNNKNNNNINNNYDHMLTSSSSQQQQRPVHGASWSRGMGARRPSYMPSGGVKYDFSRPTFQSRSSLVATSKMHHQTEPRLSTPSEDEVQRVLTMRAVALLRGASSLPPLALDRNWRASQSHVNNTINKNNSLRSSVTSNNIMYDSLSGGGLGLRPTDRKYSSYDKNALRSAAAGAQYLHLQNQYQFHNRNLASFQPLSRENIFDFPQLNKDEVPSFTDSFAHGSAVAALQQNVQGRQQGTNDNLPPFLPLVWPKVDFALPQRELATTENTATPPCGNAARISGGDPHHYLKKHASFDTEWSLPPLYLPEPAVKDLDGGVEKCVAIGIEKPTRRPSDWSDEVSQKDATIRTCQSTLRKLKQLWEDDKEDENDVSTATSPNTTPSIQRENEMVKHRRFPVAEPQKANSSDYMWKESSLTPATDTNVMTASNRVIIATHAASDYFTSHAGLQGTTKPTISNSHHRSVIDRDYFETRHPNYSLCSTTATGGGSVYSSGEMELDWGDEVRVSSVAESNSAPPVGGPFPGGGAAKMSPCMRRPFILDTVESNDIKSSISSDSTFSLGLSLTSPPELLHPSDFEEDDLGNYDDDDEDDEKQEDDINVSESGKSVGVAMRSKTFKGSDEEDIIDIHPEVNHHRFTGNSLVGNGSHRSLRR